MWQQLLNWRVLLAGIAMVIVIATIFYSRYLSAQLAQQERQKVEAWAEAQQFIAKATAEQDILFATLIMAGQNSIPVIETDEKDNITNYHNVDSSEVTSNPEHLKSLIREYGNKNPPIVTYLSEDRSQYNRYYYGESILLKQIRYYPIVQLVIVTLFIIVTLLALSTQHRSYQNQLWAGMAKETAHQLGTPLSALEGWVEMMKENPADKRMLNEMEKDIGRLKLVSDRFSKIGSTPHLDDHNLMKVIPGVVDYVKKRAPEKVQFVVESGGQSIIPVKISAPLFEWVVENILKNALDAMEGKGRITVQMHSSLKQVIIDITDTGKGISAANIAKVFNPGFTTKKRGWGLGLTLSKRIMKQYHKGELFVKHSEPGKGTTFRIILKSPDAVS